MQRQRSERLTRHADDGLSLWKRVELYRDWLLSPRVRFDIANVGPIALAPDAALDPDEALFRTELAALFRRPRAAPVHGAGKRDFLVSVVPRIDDAFPSPIERFATHTASAYFLEVVFCWIQREVDAGAREEHAFLFKLALPSAERLVEHLPVRADWFVLVDALERARILRTRRNDFLSREDAIGSDAEDV